jgi:hypothetical protein
MHVTHIIVQSLEITMEYFLSKVELWYNCNQVCNLPI